MQIVDKVQLEEIETNGKLMQLFERIFEHKVLERVSHEVVNRQVEISNLVSQLE